MTSAMLAATVAAVVAIGLAAWVVLLQRRLRLLATLVHALHEQVSASTADPASAPAPAGEPSVALITGLPATGGSDVRGDPTAGRVVSVTLAGPMIKMVALAAGLRRALDEEHRMQASFAFRRELKRQRRMRRRAAAARARQPAGWVP